MKKMLLVFLFLLGVSTAAIGMLGVAVVNALPFAEAAQQAPAQSFAGTVMKSGDTFTLSDSEHRANYQLDDAQKASRFEGKKVKVTGTLDEQNRTIRIQTIEETSTQCKLTGRGEICAVQVWISQHE